jgi:peptidoglycan/xylan/chitin deacetylase (PgdA/CDA1 family)
MSNVAQPGALVISLDFELHWGMRDHVDRADPSYADLLASRDVVTELAKLFADRGIRATWATVGFLFASTREELALHLPEIRPTYDHAAYDPYTEPVGASEEVDPEHLAGSLVDAVAATSGQEIASHTFSHYYCLEGGQNEESFRADLAAAQAIARARGLRLTSLVLPRNQWNPSFAGAVLDSGLTCFRGPQPSRGHEARRGEEQGVLNRSARLIDTYGGLTPPPTVSWDRVLRDDGLCNVPASAFLRPYDPRRRFIEPLRRTRLMAGLRDAGRRGRIFHLWWHPHNFVRHRLRCLDLLNSLLDEFDRLAQAEGMRSLSMRDVTDIVGAPSQPNGGDLQGSR